MKIKQKPLLMNAVFLLLPSFIFAQEPPVAGEIKEDSLSGKTLVFTSYGGIYQAGQMAALESFAKKSGVQLLADGPTEIAKIQAQVNSGNVTWDVVDISDLLPYIHCGSLFQRLDFTKLDISHIPQPNQVGPCSVPSMNYGTILMYKNTAYQDNPPKNWKDFFDTKNFPGIRAIDNVGEPAGLIEQAILAAGGSVQNMSLSDIDLGFDKIRALGADTIFYQSGGQAQQLAESGEVDMLMMWTGRAMEAVRNGADYSPVWQDWLVVMDQFAIPAGVKDSDAAHALINFYLGKEAQEIMAERTSYTPVHKDAKPKVDELTAAFMTNSAERMAQSYQWNVQFWADNYAVATEKWATLVSGH